jgi:hypothetical protein
MKLTPKNRLRLGKQTVRILIDDDLAMAHGGTGSADTCRTGTAWSDKCPSTDTCPSV